MQIVLSNKHKYSERKRVPFEPIHFLLFNFYFVVSTCWKYAESCSILFNRQKDGKAQQFNRQLRGKFQRMKAMTC